MKHQKLTLLDRHGRPTGRTVEVPVDRRGLSRPGILRDLETGKAYITPMVYGAEGATASEVSELSV